MRSLMGEDGSWKDSNDGIERKKIYNVLREMNQTKAPRPDIFHASFYQQCWDIMEADAVKFIKGVIEKMGFNVEWIDRIMICSRFVSFSFTINGSQEAMDPLSSYLFILCAERFSSMLSTTALDGKIHVAKCFIVRTSKTKLRCVTDIIRSYERASGQQVNLDTYKVIYSRNTSKEKWVQQATILGLRMCLGLLTVIRKLKKDVFAIIKEHVWDKLQGKKEKLLSKPQERNHAQAVAQSIPIHEITQYRDQILVGHY
ncbi:hypothetical protein Cgig2_016569 [Carnegiea gigantea]|uniref:Reverse transcriptase n=1 Tax=Carnegiea gigantea TaxID=171969 RepID=A0A9Q1KYN6_9CARY|nr:hypothetical protein Cgig2_016569 [Carnegiea gigantea]